MVGVLGCATEYNVVTGKEEWIHYTTEQEVNIGNSVSKSVAKQFKISENTQIKDRVKKIGERLAGVCDRQDLIYRFEVLEEKDVNAFSLPGGFIYVNTGLLDKATDDELACVLAHEIGHIVAKHHVKKIQAMSGYNLLRILVAQVGGSAVEGADMAFVTLLSGYSRDDEFLADELGIKYARASGFDPKAMVSFLNKLEDIMMKEPAREYVYWRTHPFIPDRIRVAKQNLGMGIDFKDYLNTQDKPLW